jgi:Na+/H+-dicarboxylate symporter
MTDTNNTRKKKARYCNLTVQILIAMLLGALLGICPTSTILRILKGLVDKIKNARNYFYKTIQMIIIAPLVLTTLIC